MKQFPETVEELQQIWIFRELNENLQNRAVMLMEGKETPEIEIVSANHAKMALSKLKHDIYQEHPDIKRHVYTQLLLPLAKMLIIHLALSHTTFTLEDLNYIVVEDEAQRILFDLES